MAEIQRRRGPRSRVVGGSAGCVLGWPRRRRRAPGQDEDSGFQTRPLEQAASCYWSHCPEGHDATQTYRSHQRKSQASFHIFQDPHFKKVPGGSTRRVPLPPPRTPLRTPPRASRTPPPPPLAAFPSPLPRRGSLGAPGWRESALPRLATQTDLTPISREEGARFFGEPPEQAGSEAGGRGAGWPPAGRGG